MSGDNLKKFVPVDFDPFAETDAGVVRFPLTEGQREIWASDQMGAEASSAYNVCHAFRLRGTFSIDAMRTALQRLFARHQALRLVCDPDGENQYEPALATMPIITEDLSALPTDERKQAITNRIQHETDLPFDLEKGPLCRAVILRENPQTHFIVFTAHHIVCDGWSTAILLQDLPRLYEAERAGSAAALPPAHAFQAYVEAKINRRSFNTQPKPSVTGKSSFPFLSNRWTFRSISYASL